MTKEGKEFKKRLEKAKSEIDKFYLANPKLKPEKLKAEGGFLLRHDEKIGHPIDNWTGEDQGTTSVSLPDKLANPDLLQESESLWFWPKLTDYQLDQLDVIEEIYHSLSERYKQVFRLVFTSGLKQSEVATRLNTSRSVINNIVQSIKKKISDSTMSK